MVNQPSSGSPQSLQAQAAALLVYQSIFEQDIGQAFLDLLQRLNAPSPCPIACLQAYGRWFSALAHHQQSWQDYLLMQVLRSPNPFSRLAQRVDLVNIPRSLVDAARFDLSILQQLYACSGEQVAAWVNGVAPLPRPLVAWSDRRVGQPQTSLAEIRKLPICLKLEGIEDWRDALPHLAAYYRQYGVGKFAEYHALRWHQGELQGISYPDTIRLSQLTGYEEQKAALVKNTEALLAGVPALHILLYGSRGSGKSSLVKALLHRYGQQGLRMIEVSKADLVDLSQIMDELRGVPQSFIIFVDDLSFEEDDDAYKALKVVLEGNLTARPSNVVVYATSNRRHLIREFFGDRPRPSDADEIHAWDTVQEKLSFSDRFGLTLTFEPADQSTYLAIVRHLAEQAELSMDPDELTYQALQWATRHNGRSGRSARQFIDTLIAQQQVSSNS